MNPCFSNIQASISLVPSQHHGNQDRLTCHSSQVVSKGRHQLSKKAHPHRTHAKYPRTEFSANGSSSKDSDQVQGYSEPDVAVCRTELPKFGVLDSYSVAVFVTWTRNDTSKSENSANAVRDTSENHNDNGDSGDRNVEGNSPTNTEHVFSRHCGEVTLRVEDVISGKYVINVFTDSDPYDVEMQDLKGNSMGHIMKNQALS